MSARYTYGAGDPPPAPETAEQRRLRLRAESADRSRRRYGRLRMAGVGAQSDPALPTPENHGYDVSDLEMAAMTSLEADLAEAWVRKAQVEGFTAVAANLVERMSRVEGKPGYEDTLQRLRFYYGALLRAWPQDGAS